MLRNATSLNFTQRSVLYPGFLSLRNCYSWRQERHLDRWYVGLRRFPWDGSPLLHSGFSSNLLLQGGLPVALKPEGPCGLNEGNNGKQPLDHLHSLSDIKGGPRDRFPDTRLWVFYWPLRSRPSLPAPPLLQPSVFPWAPEAMLSFGGADLSSQSCLPSTSVSF